jgi:hypothetical protein
MRGGTWTWNLRTKGQFAWQTPALPGFGWEHEPFLDMGDDEGEVTVTGAEGVQVLNFSLTLMARVRECLNKVSQSLLRAPCC